MVTPASLRRGEWEAIVHAPLHAYVHVAGADGEPTEAQFRRLVEEIAAGQDAFEPGSLGWTAVAALGPNLDALWAGFKLTERSPRDGLTRARKVLDRVADEQSTPFLDWVIRLAVLVAAARRTLGTEPVSESEVSAIEEVAGWLGRPVPPVD